MQQGYFYSIPSLEQAVATAGLFVSLCTIQTPSNAVSASGQVDYGDWTNVAGLVNIPCMLSAQVPIRPDDTAMVRLKDEIDVLGKRHVLLNAYYPAVKQEYVALIDGVRYMIYAVEHDSQHSQTRMSVRYWTQGGTPT